MSFLKGTMTIFVLAIVIFGQSAPSWAVITESQRLNFGRWYIASNNSVETITVSPLGAVSSSSPDLIMFTSPQPGIYTVTGLAPFTVINGVTVTMNQPMVNGAQQFTIANFTTQIMNANGAGVTVLLVGADAQTSGNASGYPAGPYTGQIDIEIDY